MVYKAAAVIGFRFYERKKKKGGPAIRQPSFKKMPKNYSMAK